jgi:hypothetical protein
VPMPLAIGYHPCYNLPGVARDEAVPRMAAREVHNWLRAGQRKYIARFDRRWKKVMRVDHSGFLG